MNLTRLARMLACISLLSGMAGCSFDDDTRYIPRTQGVFVLTDLPSGTGGEIVCIHGDEITYNWAQKPARIACMAGSGRLLWAGDDLGRKLYGYDCADGSLPYTISLPDSLLPHSLLADDGRIFCADSLYPAVAAFNKHGRLLARRRFTHPVRLLAVHSGYLLALTNSRTVYWLNITDLSARDSVSLTHPVTEAQWQQPESFVLFSRDSGGSLYQTTASYQGQVLVAEAPQDNLLRLMYSPYRRQQYGREFTGKIPVSPTLISTPFGSLAGDFVCADFFSPAVYSMQSGGIPASWWLVRLSGEGQDTLQWRSSADRPRFRSTHVYTDGDAAYGQP